MNTTFTDFLREQAAKQDATAKTSKAVIEEWRTAVQKLFDEIRSWLKESDPDSIIQVEQKDYEVTEEGLGRYHIPRLDLHALGKWIGILPKARETIAAARPPQKSAPQRAIGRVDITDELRRYILYRFPQDSKGDIWLIDDLRSEPRALDREAFEAALMSYLR